MFKPEDVRLDKDFLDKSKLEEIYAALPGIVKGFIAMAEMPEHEEDALYAAKNALALLDETPNNFACIISLFAALSNGLIAAASLNKSSMIMVAISMQKNVDACNRLLENILVQEVINNIVNPPKKEK